MEMLLKRSVNEALKLEMVYQANNGSISQRIISVMSFNEHHFIAYVIIVNKIVCFAEIEFYLCFHSIVTMPLIN